MPASSLNFSVIYVNNQLLGISSAFPFTLYRGFFYPENLACAPKNVEIPYMLLYIEGTKKGIRPKYPRFQNAVGTLVYNLNNETQFVKADASSISNG